MRRTIASGRSWAYRFMNNSWTIHEQFMNGDVSRALVLFEFVFHQAPQDRKTLFTPQSPTPSQPHAMISWLTIPNNCSRVGLLGLPFHEQLMNNSWTVHERRCISLNCSLRVCPSFFKPRHRRKHHFPLPLVPWPKTTHKKDSWTSFMNSSWTRFMNGSYKKHSQCNVWWKRFMNDSSLVKKIYERLGGFFSFLWTAAARMKSLNVLFSWQKE